MPLFKKDSDGKLKRIEYRGRHLRASRTGGVALRAQTKAAGVNLTVNSKHGVRLSRRIATGTQAGFQNGRFVLRGRYGKGPTKLNLSKSGVSVSSKTSLGTINWFKPRYSSAKIAGIQVRGKNAIYLHLITALVQMAAFLVLFAVQVGVVLVQALFWLTLLVLRSSWQALRWLSSLPRKWRAGHMASIENRWREELSSLDQKTLHRCLEKVILELGSGAPLQAPPPPPPGNAKRDRVATCEPKPSRRHKPLHDQLGIHNILFPLLTEDKLPLESRLDLITSCLAEQLAAKAPASTLIETLFHLDEATLSQGNRTQLQDRLLATYTASAGIQAEPRTTPPPIP